MPDSPADLPTEPTLERLRGRDAAAFEWLVGRTRRIVLGLGQSVGLRGADLDDAAADAFLAVYRALPAFAGRSAATTWVYRVAARTVARSARRLRRGRGVPLDEAVHGRDDSPDAHAAAIHDETAERVWRAVAALDPRSAMAVELYYRRQLPLDEVAAVLDCPVGTAKTLLHRAREALRQTLREEARP